MEIKGDELIFSTGKRAYANKGIVGLHPDGETICGGYDGYLHIKDGFEELTPEEIIDLADYMIASWEKVLLKAARQRDRT